MTKQLRRLYNILEQMVENLEVNGESREAREARALSLDDKYERLSKSVYKEFGLDVEDEYDSCRTYAILGFTDLGRNRVEELAADAIERFSKIPRPMSAKEKRNCRGKQYRKVIAFTAF